METELGIYDATDIGLGSGKSMCVEAAYFASISVGCKMLLGYKTVKSKLQTIYDGILGWIDWDYVPLSALALWGTPFYPIKKDYEK